MSKQYPGGIISKTAPVPSGPYANSTAPGIWTLEQQAAYAKQGNWPTAGNVDPSAFIENLFSTYLYTGTGASQTITNGIDLSANSGLTWIRRRGSATDHHLEDTVRGATKYLISNTTNAEQTNANAITAFNSTGFSLGSYADVNSNAGSFVSWSFREQPKFFDVVTYTGNATARTIAHNLGSVPGCIIVKCTSSADNWYVYHRSLAATQNVRLNQTNAVSTNNFFWDSTAPTSTVFSVGASGNTNQNGDTYVAYIFAHDAGGFGLTGTDNVISCGSYTGNGVVAGPSVTLGYEPQWVLVKSSTVAGSDWYLMDIMRGMAQTQCNELYPNLSVAEVAQSKTIIPTATGFDVATTDAYINNSGSTYIYIAIRRGPMKVPTVGTSVFSPIAYTGNSTTNTTVQNLTTSFAGDAVIIQQRTSGNNPLVFDKLRGKTQALYTSLTSAEQDINAFRAGESVGFNNTQTVLTGQFTANGNYNYSGDTFVGWNFKRAPGFFDEVCWTGTSNANASISHNLSAVPEFIIIKPRNNGAPRGWRVYIGSVSTYIKLESTDATTSAANCWTSTSPTSTTFNINEGAMDVDTFTMVAYLFATCAGVSKVGSYTGNGTTQTIDCGFGAGGARFVLIKRTDASGDWYVYDTARGMTVLTDPYLQLNNTNAEVATLGSVTTVSTGFALNSAILADINVSAGSYIFLAIA